MLVVRNPRSENRRLASRTRLCPGGATESLEIKADPTERPKWPSERIQRLISDHEAWYTMLPDLKSEYVAPVDGEQYCRNVSKHTQKTNAMNQAQSEV